MRLRDIQQGERLSPEEANEYVGQIWRLTAELWQEKVTRSPFMIDLRDGKLPMKAIQCFWVNWYGFVSEVNNFHGVAYQRHQWFFKTHPDLNAAYTEKIADEIIHPSPPGHITIVLEQGRAFGLSDKDMINGKLLPECRAVTDWLRGLVYEGTFSEWWFAHNLEQQIGYWAADFRQALCSKYGFSSDRTRYFQVHEEADLEVHEGSVMAHGDFNKEMIKAILIEGYAQLRPGFTVDYIARTNVDYYRLFFQGVYRASMP